MRVLITGGCGFIGTNLVARMNAVGGYDVRVFDNESLGEKEHLAGLNVEFVRGDLRNRADIEGALSGRDAVIHLAADTRDVVTTSGTGQLVAFDPLGARIALDGVQAGAEVIVRTNYHPSWRAGVEGSGGAAVRLMAVDGQLAFLAPRDGSYVVTLTYPRRPWLVVLALAAVLLGGWTLARWPGRR